jgi:hypothetical protein
MASGRTAKGDPRRDEHTQLSSRASRDRISVFVADDQRLVRAGFRVILAGEAARQIPSSCDSRVLILTTSDADEYVFEALQMSASGSC